MAEILITSALAEVVNYAGEYKYAGRIRMKCLRFFRTLKHGLFILLLILFFTAAPGACDIQRGMALPEMQLRDEKGNTVSLFNREGKKIHLIWLTDSCDSCMAGFDRLSSMAGEYSPKGVRIIIINIHLDESYLKSRITSPPDASLMILRDESWTIPGIFDGNWLKGVCPLKNLVIVDKDGIVQYVHHYPGIPPELLREELKTQLQR